MNASIRNDMNTYHLNQMKFGSVIIPDDLFIVILLDNQNLLLFK